jgi:hypothetical protein
MCQLVLDGQNGGIRQTAFRRQTGKIAETQKANRMAKTETVKQLTLGKTALECLNMFCVKVYKYHVGC